MDKWKLKGTGLINAREYMKMHGKLEEFESLVSSVFQTQKASVVASTWYNAGSSMELFKKCGEALGMDFKNFILELTEFGLDRDLNGVYRFFIKLGGPEKTLGKGPQLVKAYTTYSHLEILENKLGTHIARTTVPKEFTEWDLYNQQGAISGVLKACKYQLKTFSVESQETLKTDEGLKSASVFQVTYSSV